MFVEIENASRIESRVVCGNEVMLFGLGVDEVAEVPCSFLNKDNICSTFIYSGNISSKGVFTKRIFVCRLWGCQSFALFRLKVSS